MPSPARSGELIGQKLGKYEILALIAVGGTAEIYLARITGASGFEKYLVVKCLLDHLADDQEFVRMFLDEARIGAQLDHSNIVQTLELGEQNGRYFLVIEYLAGMSVAQMARKTQERNVNGGLIDTDLVLGLASQTCSGLHYAHSKAVQGKTLNLVHRDISPQNLVVTYEGILKIVDFGIAKSDIREAQTRTGTIKGKFAYMSPEQCLAKKIDGRTDIFALGTLCHELLTGRRLFKRQTTYDTYQAIVNGNVPKPSELNPALDSNIDEVIMKALAYEPEDRYPNAQAFGEAILTLIHKRSGSAGAGEISRFFEQYFREDLEAHAAQMRAFITGKQKAGDGTWDQDFGDDEAQGTRLGKKKKPAPIAIPKKPTGPTVGQKAAIPAIPAIRPIAKAPAISAQSVSAQSAPMSSYDEDDDDDGPTRIEFDPSSRVAAYHDKAGTTPAPTGRTNPPAGRPHASQPHGSQPHGSQPHASQPHASQPHGSQPHGSQPPAGGSMLPPVPTTDPGAAAMMNPIATPSQTDFATPPSTINVSSVPAHMQAQPLQHSQGHQQQPMPNHPGQQAMQMPAAGQQQGQPMYPAYVGSSLPIAAQGSGAVIGPPGNRYPSSEQQRQIAPPAYPTTSLANTEEPVPLWMHVAVFAVFLALGLGIAAFFKLVL